MGDPAGVGPEVILKALIDPKVRRACHPLILGDWGVLQRTGRGRKKLPALIRWEHGQSLASLFQRGSASVVCALSSLKATESRPGWPSTAGGHAAYRYIRVAAKLALSKVADAIATAPISKSILIDAGYNYPGQPVLGPLLMTAYTVVLSYFLAYAVFKSKGLWTAAYLHALNNQAMSFFVAMVVTPASMAMSFGIGLPALVLCALVVLLLLRDPVWKETD